MSQPRFNGDLARRQRIKLGYSVQQVAALLGKSRWSVYVYEGQRDIGPTPPIRRRLEDLYGLEPGDLLVDEEGEGSAA